MYICTCEICHSKFQPTTGSRNVNRYCSLECSGVGQSRAARQRYEQSPKICPTCDSPIPYEKRTNKFCCQSCAATFNNRGIRRHGQPAGTCEHCGNPNRTAAHRYCSIECFGQANTKYVTAEEKQEAARAVWRAGQAKWRAKGYRVLDPTADRKVVKEIYANCPDGYEVDHIVPLSRGGKHHEDNLQYLPIAENRRKGNRWIG